LALRPENSARFEVQVQPFVIGAAEHGIELLAELACVRGGYVRIERLLVLPDFDNRDVIHARNLRAGFDADEALVLAAIRNVLLHEFCARGGVRRHDVDMRHDVNFALRSRFLGQRASRKAECGQHQRGPHGKQQSKQGSTRKIHL
jgi:hypothetical protein